MNRSDKLASLKQKKALDEMAVFTNGKALTEALATQFTRFKEMLADGVG